jgi:hypothetical protein
VGARGLLAYVKALADLAVGAAPADEAEHLELAFRQAEVVGGAGRLSAEGLLGAVAELQPRAPI